MAFETFPRSADQFNSDTLKSEQIMAGQFGRSCCNGDLEGVRAALHAGVDVNAEVDGWTGLFWALEYKHTAVAMLLLAQEGIDVNHVDDEGTSALHWAARDEKNSECLALLLTRSDLVNQRDDDGCAPLWWAVDRNAVKCVQLLLSDPRTDPNFKSEMQGVPALMRAIWDDHPECVELLMGDARTDPNLGDDGLSPLMWAVKLDRDRCIEFLLPDPRFDLSERDNYQRSGEEVAR